jgi:hypothetical protein
MFKRTMIALIMSTTPVCAEIPSWVWRSPPPYQPPPIVYNDTYVYVVPPPVIYYAPVQPQVPVRNYECYNLDVC